MVNLKIWIFWPFEAIMTHTMHLWAFMCHKSYLKIFSWIFQKLYRTVKYNFYCVFIRKSAGFCRKILKYSKIKKIDFWASLMVFGVNHAFFAFPQTLWLLKVLFRCLGSFLEPWNTFPFRCGQLKPLVFVENLEKSALKSIKSIFEAFWWFWV